MGRGQQCGRGCAARGRKPCKIAKLQASRRRRPCLFFYADAELLARVDSFARRFGAQLAMAPAINSIVFVTLAASATARLARRAPRALAVRGGAGS
mmetsp:Transcript_30015/g.92829  ORF Transcript_30015/g.92829 Transcript_30015/m.92829 type:complete len:96 (+) Transcript_30015:2228-2515(+)